MKNKLKNKMKNKLIHGAAAVCFMGGLSAANANDVLIMRDDFESALAPTDWSVSFTAGAANVYVNDLGQLVLETIPNTGLGIAVVSSTRRFSVSDGTLMFKSRINDAYVDQAIYGDAQPRGLVAGADRSNALEFLNADPTPNTVACRTVANGIVTQTIVDIGQSVRTPNVYEIVATAKKAKFYINGVLVATHTTNIPTVPLNPYFSTGDSGAGNVPLVIDWVSFERIR